MEVTPLIHEDVLQGSYEWQKLHWGRPTASEFGQFMTSSFEYRTGEMPETYLNKKLAEKIMGHALPGFTSHSTEQGTLREEEAVPFFALEYDLPARRVGFVESSDRRCGCSPDALIGDDDGLEIKCPQADTHVGYLRKGNIPLAYVTQVYGSIFVSGRKRWHFFSYCPSIGSNLRIVVERDEEIMEKIATCLTEFYRRFDDAMKQLERDAA